MKFFNIMKKRELLQDDFLADLMKNATLESPSDDFSTTIMRSVEGMPAYQPNKTLVLSRIKSIFPWVLLTGDCVVFYLFSDLLFGKYLPNSDFMREMVLPSVRAFLPSFKAVASTKFYSIFLIILITACCLFVIERLISSRISANRHYLI